VSNPLPPKFAEIQEALQLAEMALLAQKTAQGTSAKSQQKQQEQVQHGEFSQLLAQLELAFNDGHVHEASQLLRTAQQFAKKHHLHEPRLGEWAQELQKLKEWAGFAILPKKEALVTAMAQLAETDDDDGLARLDEIKALQAEWQASRYGQQRC
jgi:exonuclease SbcC